jgi:hypothetical protein
MLALACGSGEGKTADPGADTDSGSSSTTPADDEDDTTPDTPGTLPNLSTHSDDPADGPPAEELPMEPADCEVVTLASCVEDALDELSNCLAAGHGGTFNEDNTRCELAEAGAVVSFSEAVPRWSNAPALSFELAVAGQTCGSYSEIPEGSSSFAGTIQLVTGEHEVTLVTAADQQRTLTCNGATVSFFQYKLSQCRESTAMPTPELMDQTQTGVFSVSPLMMSNTRIFNCQFLPSSH